MTAEVAIANGSAVALAADSAVTVGGRKIYNSAVKLFSFSKVEPVGIMIYGNASLLDVPWEIIIKTCRDKIGSNKYQHLEEYGDHFIDYIKQSNFFSENSQETWIESNVIGYYTEIREELFNHFKLQEKQLTESDVYAHFKTIITKHHTKLKSLNLIPNADDNFEKNLKTKHTELFDKVSNHVFQNLAIKKPENEKLKDIAVFLQTREVYSDGTSGIVIAGFGDNEIYPSIIAYEIEGYIDGLVKYKKLPDKCYKVISGNDCSIMAFAQEDMVHSFMRGINPAITAFMRVYLEHIFDRLPELLTDENLNGSNIPAQKIRDDLNNSAHKLLSDFFTELNKNITDNNVLPVINMVMSLPKDELAAMAESLVNLTAFKRKMSESLETVGGPIDVLVISKGDGLVWVKRKLYFPEELNQHFFQNYFRGINHV